MSAKIPCVSRRPIVPGIVDLPKFNYEDLEQKVDRVHLEFIGNTSRYINTHCSYAIAFIVYSIQVFSSQDDKV